MFTTGMDIDSRSYFGSITFVIGCPTSIKVFNWIYSCCCHDMLIFFECYFVYMFVFMFLCGGITGILLANCGLDIMLHDTYFVVAHFHYVLSLGAVVGFVGGFVHFLVLWFLCEYNLFFFRYMFWLLFFGSNFLFCPLHFLGVLGFPRRISDFPSVYYEFCC